MTAFADCLLALRPFAEEWRDGDPALTARDVLRKHAPCDLCEGTGDCVPTGRNGCSGAGWTPASVEAACARDEGREARIKEACRLINLGHVQNIAHGMARFELNCVAETDERYPR
jgi:hypothetical protein